MDVALENTNLEAVDVALNATTKKLLVRIKDGQDRGLTDDLNPDLDKLVKVDTAGRVRGVIITVKSTNDPSCNFKSRYFSPWNGIGEDPVTGSAHTVLAPYWKDRLGMAGPMEAKQVSQRSGHLWIKVNEEENVVRVSGEAAIVLQGSLQV